MAPAGPGLDVLVAGFSPAPAPAYAISARFDGLAHNQSAGLLFGFGDGSRGPVKCFRHPSAGTLTLHSTSLLIADDPMTRVVALQPATAADAAKLELLRPALPLS